jgi:hypothetical protein
MFRFTIRVVLWLTVVVGMCAAWACDHRRQQAPLDDLHAGWRLMMAPGAGCATPDEVEAMRQAWRL